MSVCSTNPGVFSTRAVMEDGLGSSGEDRFPRLPPIPGADLERQQGRFDSFGAPSGNDRYLRILFSNGSRRKLLPDVDAFGCLRSLRARSALDGVSWVQGG